MAAICQWQIVTDDKVRIQNINWSGNRLKWCPLHRRRFRIHAGQAIWIRRQVVP